ncbi:MAG: hydrogenase maturation nickel metallochaperone HypA [candidate division KSB1 bacterium]|nr:hydrogenase maturation nickel metallochaperone HypA [candidate division KSB1 bacterium]
MHELSIAESIISIVLGEMSSHDMTKVDVIKLRIGEMRQVVADSLLFGFECLTKNTPLENARIEIENIPVTARCVKCKSEFQLKNWLSDCPVCKQSDVEIISGKELEIAEFEGS